MAEGAAIRGRRGSLGLWILGPVLGLAALILAIGPLPKTGCGPEVSITGSGAGVFYLALAGALTAAAIGTGAWRLARVGSRDALIRAAGFGGAVAVGLLLARLVGGSHTAAVPLVTVFVIGLVVTFCAFSILVVSWWERARTEEAGLALPVYLLGTGFFVYPSLVDIVASLTSGTWGC
jgi:hypothetical protein